MADEKWTFASMEEWVRSSFAQRDEVARIARDEANRVEDHVERLRGATELTRRTLISREEYDRRHDQLAAESGEKYSALRDYHDNDVAQLKVALNDRMNRNEDRISSLERWRANYAGRAIAVGVLGAILVAVAASIITHLAGGG